MTCTHTAERFRLAAAVLLASLLITTATVAVTTPGAPPPDVVAGTVANDPGGFEIGGGQI